MKGIFIYTIDDSFTGADLFAQKVSLKFFEEFFASDKTLSQPKPLQSSYDFLNLLDGRCGKFVDLMDFPLNIFSN